MKNRIIERRIYDRLGENEEYKTYLQARFGNANNLAPFVFEGNAWEYKGTYQDDDMFYDLIVRAGGEG